jgi:hypothetical protein
MTSIRIAVASVLLLGGAFAGGTAHAGHSEAPATARAVALGAAHMSKSPPVCC